MAQFTPSKKTIKDFNDGEEYLNRIDVVQADTINNLVEGLLYAQESGGTTITQALAGKADKSALDNYVTLDTEQEITAKKDFRDGIRVDGNDAEINDAGIFLDDGDGDAPETRITCSGLIRTWADWDAPVRIYFPQKSGALALVSDITWENLLDKPSSLTPSGAAGGDLTGTYPNPTIGTGKVTEAKIGALAVTEEKIAANAVTSEKIANGAVTDDKLNTTGVIAGTYSVVTVTTKGRVTAGANLFTIGTATTIPSSVPTNGFYLQQV